MLRQLSIVAVAVAAALTSPAKAEFQSTRVWEQAGWSVSIVRSDAQLLGCSAKAVLVDRTTGTEDVQVFLYFTHELPDQWWGYLSGERIKAMTVGPVELVTDGKVIARGIMNRDRPSLVLERLSHRAIDELIAAPSIEIVATSERLTIPLTGSARALSQTTQCLNDAITLEAKSKNTSLPAKRFRVLHTVSQGVANMRREPAARAELVIPIPAGSRNLEVVDGCRVGDTGPSTWCHVRWRGEMGWVFVGGLIEEVSAAALPQGARTFGEVAAAVLGEELDRSRRQSTPDRKDPAFSSGSAIFISRHRHLLTNAHVIDGCKAIGVAQPGRTKLVDARVLARDDANDLALLLAPEAEVETVAALRTQPRLGEDVAVFGYPLAGMIASSGNFTRGTVSALTGINDDTRHLQITAPIQPGNSGGPVLDRAGNVIAVVVGKLASKSGSFETQQVNFAIKSSTVLGFLEGNGRDFEGSPGTTQLDGPDLAEKAKRMSAFVLCLKN